MELTEERVREIVREEIAEHGRESIEAIAYGIGERVVEPVPRGMMRLEAINLRDMGLDPFEEADKPKPIWMTYPEAAELRVAGTDPMTVSRDSIRDNCEAR